MMRSPTLSQGETAPPGGHVLPLQCSCCSACSRRCTQTFRDKQVSFAEPLAGVSVVLREPCGPNNAVSTLLIFFHFFFFFKSHPSHQQAISSAFSLTVLWGASKRDSSSPFSLTHKYRQTHTPTRSFFLGVGVFSLLMSTLLSTSHFLACFLTSRRG